MNIAVTAPTRGDCPAALMGRCEYDSLGEFEDKSGKVGHVEVLRCRHCGVGITMPPLADVAFLYEGRESQDFQPRTGRFAYWIKQIAFRRQARALLRDVGMHCGRVLDYGCGSGLFTRCLGDILNNATVIGSDFHDEPPAALLDRPYVPSRALTSLEGTFDLVLAMHVLEHDDDPEALLRRILRMMRPGGVVVIEVPNIDCFWTALLGRSWDAWYLPFHRTHFSKRSLEALAKRSGLDDARTIDACVPTMGRSLANLLRSRSGIAFLLAGIALHPLQWIGEKISGRPSALRLIARRI